MTTSINFFSLTKEPVSHPILGCECCGKLTRHYFATKVRLPFRHFEENPRPYKSEPWEVDLLVYRCINCGCSRGWGNEAVDETENED